MVSSQTLDSTSQYSTVQVVLPLWFRKPNLMEVSLAPQAFVVSK
jgi:hypothetical protein